MLYLCQTAGLQAGGTFPSDASHRRGDADARTLGHSWPPDPTDPQGRPRGLSSKGSQPTVHTEQVEGGQPLQQAGNFCLAFANWLSVSYINHTMVWIGRDVKDHPVQTLHPDQIAQTSIQPGLGYFQGWGIHGFSGKPVPVPLYPQ